MCSCLERVTIGPMLLGWLGWAVLATPVLAQPLAMPLTVLDNRGTASIQHGTTQPALPGQQVPQPMVVPEPAPPFNDAPPRGDPPPCICPADGAVALPNPQDPLAAVWTPPWTWQVLPDGLMFKNYLASNEEGRLGAQLYHDKNIGWTWDSSLGAHVGILRYGTQDPIWPEGWQFDVDAVALPRLDSSRSIESVDFRAGFPITHRAGPWEWKFGYYHLSSHLGDLYIESHPGAMRLDYVREQLVLGVAYRPILNLRFYGEANYAFIESGGSRPWEFQFGIDYSPEEPTGLHGAPFVAINSKIQEDLNYSGNVTFEAGWEWRGPTGHTLRTGVEYFDGFDFQRQFYSDYRQFIGAGVWYDF